MHIRDLDSYFKCVVSAIHRYSYLDLFLGIDLSTQSCKATLLDSTLAVTHSATVIFEEDLPQYNAKGGILIREGGVVVSPTLMVFTI